MQEMWIQSLGQEDLLEEGMATHSSILVWKIPWTEEPGGLQSMGSRRARYDWAHTCAHTITIKSEHGKNQLKRNFSVAFGIIVLLIE